MTIKEIAKFLNKPEITIRKQLTERGWDIAKVLAKSNWTA